MEKLVSKDAPFTQLPKAEQGLISSIASSLVFLLTALAEAQDDILLSISNHSTIVNLLFALVSSKPETAGELASLRTDSLACLMILCEDNTSLAESVLSSQEEGTQVLMTLKDEVNSDGILACAILHNLFASLASSKHADEGIPDDSVLIPTLSKAVAGINLAETAVNGSGWTSPFEYQQLALETLASIGTTLNLALGEGEEQVAEGEDKKAAKDDEDMGDADDGASDKEDAPDAPDAEEEDDEEDDEMDEDEMEADMEMVTGADISEDADRIDDTPVLKALLNSALPELLRVAASQPSNEDAMKLQGHALSALNNIAWSVSLIDLSDDHNQGIKRAWSPIGRSIWERVVSPILASDTADIDLATHVTGLAWAVARSLHGRTPLKSGEQRRFITLYQATKSSDAIRELEDPFQGLGVKCVGVLGQLALHPAPVDLNREIGTFLVTILAGLPNTPPADAVEALNQIFDIYGDEEYPYDKEVFWKDGYLKHLEEIMPKARAMLKGIDKKTHNELRTRADEAVLNLSRFLAYKRKHKP